MIQLAVQKMIEQMNEKKTGALVKSANGSVTENFTFNRFLIIVLYKL
ncbi:hypothetical protein MKY30_01775 [Oceanobacillus sp. FSL W8-0428]